MADKTGKLNTQMDKRQLGIRISKTSWLLPHAANPNSVGRLTCRSGVPVYFQSAKYPTCKAKDGTLPTGHGMEHKKEGGELCWLVYGGQRDRHRLPVPAEPELVVSPSTPPARPHPEARDVCRRPCRLADGVEQAPGKSHEIKRADSGCGFGFHWVHQQKDAVRLDYLMRAGR